MCAMAAICLSLLPAMQGQSKSSAPQTTQAQQTSLSGRPLAVLGGEPVYEEQLPATEVAQLRKMEQQVYGVRMRGLHAVIDPKLVEAEAKKKGVTPDVLFQTEVVAKVPEPTEDQVREYYRSEQAQTIQSYDEIKDQIRSGLKDNEIQRLRTVYMQGLFEQAVNNGDLLVLMQMPKIEMPVDPARLRGDPRAPVTIVEFSDFSCVFCRRAESTLDALLAKYPGKVRIAYRDFPLRQLHPQAQMAAEASRCAGEQGRFWEYHDLLFTNAEKQSRDGLLEDARSLKLDTAQFDACLSSGRYKPQIDQDIQMGSRAGVMATPGFFINGVFVNGAQPEATFEKIIDEELSVTNRQYASH